jgi:outer membrane lipase/esterase
MRGFFRAICASAFAAALGTAITTLPAAASPYSSLVVFGDSLSDSGNAALLGGTSAPNITGNTYIPSQAYAPSANFSNGPVWASDVAAALGVPLQPSVIGGTNFAFGGSTTGGPGPSPNLITQAGIYLASTGHVASPTALYVVEGGGNDARAALGAIAGGTATIQSTALSFAANIASIVNALEVGGAQHIIVWDTPNLGLAPAVAAQGAAALASLLATDMNLALANILASDTRVSIFDIFHLGTSIANNPAVYGLTNVTDACGAAPIGTNCNNYEYWDGIHPTAAAHHVIADAFIAQAVPEASTWAMLLIGFAGVGYMTYRRKSKSALMSA